MMILWYNAEVISNLLTVLKSLIKIIFLQMVLMGDGSFVDYYQRWVLTELLFIWQEVQMNDDETALNLLYNQVFYTII